MKRNQKGFTLIELLIVIAIIAILAAVIFVALDPLTRFQEARDSTRWSDVSTILDSVKLHQVDNQGVYLATITALNDDTAYKIGTCAADGADCTATTTQAACVDLTGLVTDGYLGEVPMDPSTGTAAETDYYMVKNANGTVTVGACGPETGTAIDVVR